MRVITGRAQLHRTVSLWPGHDSTSWDFAELAVLQINCCDTLPLTLNLLICKGDGVRIQSFLATSACAPELVFKPHRCITGLRIALGYTSTQNVVHQLIQVCFCSCQMSLNMYG